MAEWNQGNPALVGEINQLFNCLLVLVSPCDWFGWGHIVYFLCFGPLCVVLGSLVSVFRRSYRQLTFLEKSLIYCLNRWVDQAFSLAGLHFVVWCLSMFCLKISLVNSAALFRGYSAQIMDLRFKKVTLTWLEFDSILPEASQYVACHPHDCQKFYWRLVYCPDTEGRCYHEVPPNISPYSIETPQGHSWGQKGCVSTQSPHGLTKAVNGLLSWEMNPWR